MHQTGEAFDSEYRLIARDVAKKLGSATHSVAVYPS
jgi:hypothetical protein